MDDCKAKSWITHYVGNSLFQLPFNYEQGNLSGADEVRVRLISSLEELEGHSLLNFVLERLRKDDWRNEDSSNRFREWYSNWKSKNF
ncbi:MAG: hypothetical protein KKF68_03345 [Nanoarchaeota archaeon]|nr:hypothetical protein [Nanoarchaeota archaeon]